MGTLPQYMTGQNQFGMLEPIENGLAKFFQRQQWQQEQALKQQQLDMERQRVGFEGERLGFERDRQPGILQHQNLQNTQAQNVINREPLHRAGMEADTHLKRQHGNYYGAAGQAVLQKADNGVDRNNILRQKVMGDILQRFNDPDRITEAEWNGANQPGGLVHVGFGRPIPYEQRSYVLAQARERANAPPEVGYLMDKDVSPEEIERARYHKTMEQLYGPANKGFRYERMPNGQPTQRSIAERDTAGERQADVIAKVGIKNLDDAERILNDSSWWQRIAGDRWKVGSGTIGGFGETGRGFDAAKMAILDLNFALSGKSVSNAEREAFLSLYAPTAMDGADARKFKMAKVRQYFQTVIEARKRGATDEQVGDMYRGFLQDGQQTRQTQPGQRPAAGPDRAALQKEADDAIARGADPAKVRARMQQMLQGGR